MAWALSLLVGAAFAGTRTSADAKTSTGATTEKGNKARKSVRTDSTTCSYTGWVLSGFTLLDSFEEGNLGESWVSGGVPLGPVIQDACGNLYGTTAFGGGGGNQIGGVVYELPAGAMGTQVETTMHAFPGTTTDGQNPGVGLLLDSAGNLYGTTFYGGQVNPGETCGAWDTYGTVFELNAGSAVTSRENSTDTLLYEFSNFPNVGSNPTTGLVRDSSGNLYGVGQSCGIYGGTGYGQGAIFKLSPGAGSTWTASNLYNFPPYSASINDPLNVGVNNQGYLAMDSSGNLYGTTYAGGAYAHGSVFKLSPGTGDTWIETTLYSFQGGTTDGCNPYAEPVLDSSGNLYGTTYNCGAVGNGIVWKLTPTGTETILHNFTGYSTNGTGENADGANPVAGVALDAYDNLYGTTINGGEMYNGQLTLCANCGVLYEISTSSAYSVLHHFWTTVCGTSPNQYICDGAQSTAAPLVAQDGNIYGTTLYGSSDGGGTGTVWGYPISPSASVIIAGNGAGTVTSTPAGINCPGNCRYVSQSGKTVALTAAAEYGSKFGGWSGACSGAGTCSVTLTGTATSSVTANFISTMQVTTTTVVSSSNPSYYGQGVTFTATVSAASGVPTGAVTFYNGTTTLGTATLSGGKGMYSTNTLPTGLTSVAAVYSGDSKNLPSTSSALSQAVYQVASSTTLTSSPNPSAVNQIVTFTATVAGQNGGTPTGAVAFYEGTAKLGTGALSNGTAGYTISVATAGTYSITAIYLGDSNFTGSTSPAVNQVVNTVTLIATATTLTTSKASSPYGASVTFSATVKAKSGTPAGNVTFVDETTSTTLGTVSLTSGVATYTTNNLSVGKHTIEASYAGNSPFEASSKTVTQTVTVLATTTTLISSPNPSTSGETVTLTATVEATESSEVPTGSVTFTDETTSTTLGTGTLNASGEATLSTITLAVGKHTIKAVYVGATEFKPSNSKTVKQTVNSAS
ncbi:MAG: Ig-like domain repeat protein [Terriglobales bacterium]